MKQHPGQCAVFQPWSEDEQTEETGETLTLVEPEVTAELPECKDHSIADVKQHSKQEECEKSSAIGTQSASGGAKRASVKARRKVDSASVMATDPEVTSLARELAYLSNGEINFSDKQRIRFAEVLKEFTSEEIKSAFKSWLDDQDLSEPKNVSFLPGQFVQVVDGLAYASRRLKQEAEQAKIARDAAVAQLQAQAEAERLQREKAEKAEAANLFDPLADVA
jgi:hypothetical protein